MKESRTLALIPARGGSKGIYRKNIKEICGKPLIAYSIEAALSSTLIDDVIVSTDDVEIAEASILWGAETPFIRPTEISGDGSSVIDAISHALTWLAKNNRTYSTLVLLQPTSPLRTGMHIDEAIKIYEQSSATSLVSVNLVDHIYNPESLLTYENGVLISNGLGFPHKGAIRQQKKVYYAKNGPAILITRPSNIFSGSLYGDSVAPYMMDKISSIDIDDIYDFTMAEAVMKYGYEK